MKNHQIKIVKNEQSASLASEAMTEIKARHNRIGQYVRVCEAERNSGTSVNNEGTPVLG